MCKELPLFFYLRDVWLSMIVLPNETISSNNIYTGVYYNIIIYGSVRVLIECINNVLMPYHSNAALLKEMQHNITRYVLYSWLVFHTIHFLFI